MDKDLKNEILEKLSFYDTQEFKFDPAEHKYTYKGTQFESVTTFIQKFHRKFDNEYWVKKKAEDDGVSVEEKQKEWDDKNKRANIVGTATHDWIENYYNGIHQKLPSDLEIIKRINKFNYIYAKKLHKLTPVVFEKKIFSEKFKLAGTIDSIFCYEGKIFIFDWKTNKEFLTVKDRKGKIENLIYPFDSLYKNHLSEYSIQLSLYALIIQEVGIDIHSMYLCYIPPGDKKPHIYKAYDLRKEIQIYFGDNNLFDF